MSSIVERALRESGSPARKPGPPRKTARNDDRPAVSSADRLSLDGLREAGYLPSWEGGSSLLEESNT